ncbi:MAG TPA: maleylpyruvate isomerase family mycothiol-dependent enzyme [Nakamurella sp.]
MTTTTDPATVPRPLRCSGLEWDAAMALAAAEYERFADVIVDLGADDWGRPTRCPAWDVRQLACHVIGMAEFAADQTELARQEALAGAAVARRGGAFIDALTALQVQERESWLPADVVASVRAAGRRAAAGRAATPAQVRDAAMPAPFVFNGSPEWWSVGYLVGTILTRDVWMHRIDLCAAVGSPLAISADHDGVIVADVVDEWAQRHGRPFSLTLTGTAGGVFARGHGGDELELDAIEFATVVSGRGTGTGLLATQVPF